VKLIVAEKPSVAKAIRDCLPAGSDYAVTNCFGHLLELAQPHEYDQRWAKWNVADLPIRVKTWRLNPKADAKVQIGKIADLLKSASIVVNAGDPDREGQLLVDEVLEHLGWKGPTQRLLLNATDPASVKKALAKIEDNAKYRPVRDAAACRSQADWLIGMNMSRAVTKVLSDGALVSIGRVQTPTLALIVRRQREIDAFKSETFYKLRATFVTAAGVAVEMMAEPRPRVVEERIAQALARAVAGKSSQLDVETASTVRRAPLPYDLASFQKDAESAYGWGAAQSLAALQASYEAKLTSYPRTDCRYLPSEQAGDALPIARKTVAALVPQPDAKLLALMAPASRIYDSKKVEEHHGLVPTGLVPTDSTPANVRKAWELVTMQFLRSLLPDSKVEESRVSAVVDVGGRIIKTVEFSANFERILNDGASWEALPRAGSREDARKVKPLPSGLSDDDAVTATRCEAVEAKTTPPKPYTEASLIADMRSVAKYVQDAKLKAVLKETSGIGTAATQAETIETLKRRGFIRLKGKVIMPTELGCQVIDTIPPEMTDVGVTAAWEDALGLIAKGKYDPSQFMAGIDAVVERWLEAVKAAAHGGPRITAQAQPAPQRSATRGRAKAPGSSRQTPTRTARQ
jgi:DNA topoisomerase-3